MRRHLGLFIFTAILIPQIALAAINCGNEKAWQIVPPSCLAKNSPKCEIEEMACVGLNISRLILGFVGSAALLMFVYGGATWVISGGSSEKVNKGKTIILNALKGMALIFASWLIINLVVAALTGQSPGENVLLFRGQDKGDLRPLEIPPTTK